MIKKLLIGILGVATCSFWTPAKAAGEGKKSMLFTLPLVSIAQDKRARVEFNLSTKGSIALEGSYMPEREELREDELKERDGDSLKINGREYKIMFARYSQGAKMGGWYWGLGFGQRTLDATWVKSPYALAEDQFGLEDENGKITNKVRISGTTLEGRGGYRYVSSDLGFVIGIYLGIRHYQNTIHNSDDVELSDPNDSLVEIHSHDEGTLSRRLMSRMVPDIEIGWSF
ncbi:MAG: hypothetical protein R3B45_07930 [Bdellovibrionota bacterium]